jgi:hypothetical protein
MRRLYAEHGGDRERVIDAYVEADQRGEAPRLRDGNNTSSREYAIRLWANGKYHGWLDDGKHPRSLEPKSAVATQQKQVPIFDAPLRLLGSYWALDPARPRPEQNALDHWSALVDEWIAEPSLPLLVRKGGDRGVLRTHASGRTFTCCDNSPAHWAFMGAIQGELPCLADVAEQLRNGELPTTFARARREAGLLNNGECEPCGGFLAKSRYGQVNRFPDGSQYKLCHIKSVGIGARGEVQDLDIQSLKRHMRLLLDPANMMVVPLEYSGVGECRAFLDAFSQALDSQRSF